MTDLGQNALTAKRVGQYLIDAGVLKREQLEEALDRQKRMSRAGFHVLLGTILEEMGAIDRQSLEAIILRQRLDEGSVSLGAEAEWPAVRSRPEDLGTLTTPTDGENRASEQPAAEEAESPVPEVVTVSDLPPVEAVAVPDVAQTEPQLMEPEAVVERATPPADSTANAEQEPSVTEGETSTDKPEPAQRETGGKGLLSFFGWHTERRQEPQPKPESASSEPEEQPPVEMITDGPIEAEAAPAMETSMQPDVEAVQVIETAEELEVKPFIHPVADEPQVETAVPSDAIPESVAQPEAQEKEVAPETPQPVEPSQVVPEATTSSTSPPAAPAPSAGVTSGERVTLHGWTFARVAVGGLEESEVGAAVSQLLKHVRSLEDQVNEAKQGLAHIESMRRYGEQTIKAADMVADQIHNEAEKQAAAIRDRAQQEAQRIVGDAKGRYEQIMKRAGERAHHVVEEIRKNIEEHAEINRRLEEVVNNLKSMAESESGDASSGTGEAETTEPAS